MKLMLTKLSRWKVKKLYFLLYCLVFMTNIEFSKSENEACLTCSCSEVSGMVNCTGKGLKEIPDGLPNWTRRLILDDNRLTSNGIYNFDFGQLGALEELDLNGNKIFSLKINLIGNPLLRKISASHCSLSNFPNFEDIGNITDLDLSHNSIVDLEGRFQNLTSLVTLDLSFNKIRQIKQDVFIDLKTLENLNLQKNRLISIKWDAFTGLDSIVTLDLSRNRMREVGSSKSTNNKGECDGVLQTLKHLNLGQNLLTQVEALGFPGMCALESLRIDRNRIEKLNDGAFYGPTALKTLILDHNFIGSVSKGWLFQVLALETLSVSYNNLTVIEEGAWPWCEKLVHLNLSHNRLPYLQTRGFAKLQRLQTLDLDSNRISYLSDYAFDGLEKLKSLDLSNNQISSSIEDIDLAFKGLDSIERLSLRNNRIRSLSSAALEGIESIVTLDLCGNDVTSIHNNTFEKMTNLKNLSIVSSSFMCDCQLAWFPEWLRMIQRTRNDFKYTVRGSCFHPSTLKGVDVLNISKEEFVCVDNPLPVLLEEPREQTALKGDNITFECRASAMLTGEENSTFPTPITLPTIATTTTTTTTTHRAPFGGKIGRPIPGGFPARSSPADSLSRMADAPVRSGGLPLKADPNPPAEKARNSHQRRDVTAPIYGMTVMWKHSDRIVTPGSNIDVRQTVQRQGKYIYVTSRLVLKGVTSEDNGQYNCIVGNSYGYAHSKEVDLVVNQFPKFTKTPANVTIVLNGSSPILECGAEGQPPPQITWQKDGGNEFLAATERRLLRQQTSARAPLPEGDDYNDSDPSDDGQDGMMLKPDRTESMDGKDEKFTVDTDAPLEFNVVLPKDTGEYECVVESSVGRIVAKAMLIVEVAPSLVKDVPKEAKSFVGNNIAIECPVEAIPDPEISWSRDGHPINSTSRYIVTKDRKMLIVKDVQKDDAGSFSCSASNKHGTVSHVVTVVVTTGSGETMITLLLNGDMPTLIFVAIVLTALILCIIISSACCICYRKKQKEKALSTNTDETDIEPGHLDVHSYSSDGSVPRNGSSNSLHMVGHSTNNRTEVNSDDAYLTSQYRTSASMSDIARMQIQTPGARSHVPLMSNGFVERPTPERSLSTAAIRKEFIPISRFRSSENCETEGNPGYCTTRTSNTQQQPLTSPSTVFAKKAAGADNYTPVVIKSRSDRKEVAPTNGRIETKSKPKKRVKKNPKQTNKEQNNSKQLHHNGLNGKIPNSDLNPHRDRRKPSSTSQSGNNLSSESSSPLLHRRVDFSNKPDSPAPPSDSTTDRLLS